MKLCKCSECGDSKSILVEINSFTYEYHCITCYNQKHSTNYFLRKQEDKPVSDPRLFMPVTRS